MNHGANQSVKRRTQGFTLIELMLAMTFISLLLIAIAMTVIQITGIYNRGLALKEVNQAARNVSDNLRETVVASEPLVIANDYIATTTGGNGRLCLGNYTYIWNTARAFLAGGDPIRYDSSPALKVQLIRVPDPAKIYCSQPTGTLVYKNIRTADTTLVQELVDPGEHKLALSDFSIGTAPPSDPVTFETLYTLNYTLIAGDTSSMNPTQTACLEPSVSGANLNYCNVQRFTIVLRV